jgi:hypothetical protein
MERAEPALRVFTTVRFVQVSEFTNQQACCGDIREQRMTTAGNRGDAIDLMVQGMTTPAQ